MPELIRNIVGRLRAVMGNRRSAPRFKARLEVELALARSSTSGAKKVLSDEAHRLTLSGHTRDLSTSGLALVLPAIRIGGDYLTGENLSLEITLKLPDGAVTIHGKPVRYAPLDEDAEEKGYLVGVRIEGMSEEDRARFDKYLEGIKR